MIPRPQRKLTRDHSRPRWIALSILSAAAALASGAFAACGGDLEEGSGHVPSLTEKPGGQASDDSGADKDGDFDVPTKDACAGHADDTLCDENVALSCSAEGTITKTEDCGSNLCVAGKGCQLCVAGDFSCQGNTVATCDTSGSDASWTLGDTCNGTSDVCDVSKGGCVPIVPTGSAAATGTYYQFGNFAAGSSEYLGGADADSFKDKIYVNRGGYYLDVYKLELVDSDGDGLLEPNQHPDNPDATGPIEERKLTLLKTYTVPELGKSNMAELHATADKIYFVGEDLKSVYQFDLASEVVSKRLEGSIRIAMLGHDDVNDIWYGAPDGAERKVYAYDDVNKTWALRFQYPDFAGSHMDGLEVVVDEATNTPYVYVSDMTSDYLGQYRFDRKLGWVQENVFEYSGTGEYVEGMGFGALNHFWTTGPSNLYEIGGGDLTAYVEPQEPPQVAK